MDSGELRSIIKEEVGTNLNQISESIKQLKPKPKGVDYTKILAAIITGALGFYLLYRTYILLQPLLNTF